MMSELTTATIQKALDWAYDKAVNGVPGLDSAQQIAADYAKQDGSLRDRADSLIRWQIAKCATSGFVTGLGGLMTLPLAIPANLTSVLYVQLRMVAALAHLGGHDVREDRVRTLAYACLCGTAATDVLKEIGIQVGTKLTTTAVRRISGEVIVQINRAVGFRLLTKFGEKGVINLGKAIPVVGGVIGGTVDAVTTNAIGNIARTIFIEEVSGGAVEQASPA
jgi:uncharacterized protein (DUF697 family)